MLTAFAAAPTPTTITLIADPQVVAIPIHDNEEDWVDLTKKNTIIYGPSPEIPNNKDYTYLRKTVYDKLVEAQAHLPKGLHFFYMKATEVLLCKKCFLINNYLTLKAASQLDS